MPGVFSLAAVALTLASPFQSSIAPLPADVRAQLRQAHVWQPGCPVALSNLRLLTVTHRDFDGRPQTGQLVVNKSAARPLQRVFRRLYGLYFPIRHLQLDDAYGRAANRPTDGDVSGSFECRRAAASPCARATTTKAWSNHAFGLAVDLNPVENPYVGCGQSRNPRAQRYRDRSRHRRGMVTRQVVAAFASIGWGWGGSWSGNTKDYMHFSPPATDCRSTVRRSQRTQRGLRDRFDGSTSHRRRSARFSLRARPTIAGGRGRLTDARR